jgi:hypothetical protein
MASATPLTVLAFDRDALDVCYASMPSANFSRDVLE